jgi:hypothetical protein
MARSALTPLGALVRGLAAGVVGTAAMDLFGYVRYKRGGGKSSLLGWEFASAPNDWAKAPAPAQVGKRLYEGFLQRELPPTRAAPTNTLVHWAYGTSWGSLYGILAGSARSPRAIFGLALGAGVWAADYVLLPLARLYKPIWQYDAGTLAQDLGTHLVYGLGTGGAFALFMRRRREAC